MKKLQIVAALLILNICSFAQSTTLTLSTSDNTNSFHVNNTNTTSLFKVTLNGQVGVYQSSPRAQLEVGGNEGLLVTGTYNSGTALSLGTGTRLHWYPRKGAFRVGYTETTYWDDTNLGLYSIAMGYRPRATGTHSVAIGYTNYSTADYALALGVNCQATANRSIAIGSNSISSGENSIALGTNIDLNGKYGSVVISDHHDDGFYVTASDDNEMTMRFYNGYRLFTSETCGSGVTMSHGSSSWSTVSDSTKKENFRNADGEYFLNSLSKLELGSWNYKSQDAKQFRHYGPMAQEIFYYFGKDKFGVIGNDTTLATADMDGIMMICLQALEKRSDELKMENGKWKMENVEMKKENEEMKKELAAQQNIIEEMGKRFAAVELRLNSLENNSLELSCGNSIPISKGVSK